VSTEKSEAAAVGGEDRPDPRLTPVLEQARRRAPLWRRDPGRWLRVEEIWLVFALSLGASGVYALVRLIGDLTAGAALSTQVATLNGTQAPGRPWLDLTYQLLAILTGLIPVWLVSHFLRRGGETLRTIGLRPDRRQIGPGLALAAIIGGAGLGLYLAARGLGANLTVVPEDLPDVWWRIPILILSAWQNALLEEVLVAAYLLHRLRGLGWSDDKALVTSALLRGSYHLYQGFGGFAGNAVMGLIFGRIWQRSRRTTSLVIAHATIDTVAFVGYALLRGKVSWLPVPD
jgi:membrane protease YdiL (CAAX protease family)